MKLLRHGPTGAEHPGLLHTDGTIRDLLGTLEPGFLQPENVPNGKGKPNYDEAIPVFDMERQEWRAFKPDNVLELHSV